MSLGGTSIMTASGHPTVTLMPASGATDNGTNINLQQQQQQPTTLQITSPPQRQQAMIELATPSKMINQADHFYAPTTITSTPTPTPKHQQSSSIVADRQFATILPKPMAPTPVNQHHLQVGQHVTVLTSANQSGTKSNSANAQMIINASNSVPQQHQVLVNQTPFFSNSCQFTTTMNTNQNTAPSSQQIFLASAGGGQIGGGAQQLILAPTNVNLGSIFSPSGSTLMALNPQHINLSNGQQIVILQQPPTTSESTTSTVISANSFLPCTPKKLSPRTSSTMFANSSTPASTSSSSSTQNNFVLTPTTGQQSSSSSSGLTLIPLNSNSSQSATTQITISPQSNSSATQQQQNCTLVSPRTIVVGKNF